MIKHIQLLVLGFCCLVISSLNSAAQKSGPQATKPIVIRNVQLITMDSANSILPNATVLIDNHRIVSINDSIPQNASIIDGKGKWLIPGLVDMHVHLATDVIFGEKKATQLPDLSFNIQDIMTPFIANGVTTIFELNASMETYSEKKDIERGYVIGPRMALAALIDGGKGTGRRVNTPEDGRQAVRSAKIEGYDFIKIYAYLNVETYFAIVDEANKLGIKTIGHIPDFTGKWKLKDAFVKGFGMVAHAEELTNFAVSYSQEEADSMAKMLKDNGTWLSPTLIVMEKILSQVKSLDELKALPTLKYVHPIFQSKWLTANKYNKMHSPENIAHFEKYAKFNLLLVNACKKAGVPIVAGTDAGTSSVVNGFSLHDELDLLVKAGLTTQEALHAATILPAQWLGIDKQIGSIETGKLADLILLNENPLDNIQNIRKIAGVMVNGKWIEKKTIQTMLANLAARNNASKDQFDWKTITSPKK